MLEEINNTAAIRKSNGHNVSDLILENNPESTCIILHCVVALAFGLGNADLNIEFHLFHLQILMFTFVYINTHWL